MLQLITGSNEWVTMASDGGLEEPALQKKGNPGRYIFLAEWIRWNDPPADAEDLVPPG